MESTYLADADKLEKEILAKQSAEQYAGGEMLWPAPGNYRITSYFGNRPHPIYGYASNHSGMDIGCATGSSVVAANDGTVILSGWYGAYGNCVIIDHGGGIVTVYGHHSKNLVKEGDKVTRGQQIALSGNTGMSTGPHLHFEVRVNGIRKDPLDYLQN